MIEQTKRAMIGYFASDPRRVNHFLKVHSFARAIGVSEHLPAREQEILELAALTHDIGIKNAEAKFGSAAGHYQQTEGPPVAEKLLRELGVTPDVIKRVCWLIARHHIYKDIAGADYQILIEADFLVNAYEDNLSQEAITNFAGRYFKTAAGKEMLRELYGVIL